MSRSPVLLVALACACSGAPAAPSPDARPPDAAPPADAGPAPDGGDVLGFVDVAISGCLPGQPDGGTCSGHVPLELSFAALAPAAIDSYVWRFGDGTEDNAASPVHRYDQPGSYDVSLVVGGPSGTAMVSRPGAVTALPALPGHACAADDQCGALECVCDDQTACAPNLADGLCTAACDAATPCAFGVCAALAPAPPAAPEDWQRALCVLPCADDPDCPGSHRCLDLLDVAGAWTRACFADGALRENGASCADPDGAFDDSACAGGRCVGEGVRGMCASPCVPGSCPASSACASFDDPGIGAVCVARCAGPDDCAGDPRLACEAAGGTGGKRFTVDEEPAPAGYCAPKRCASAADCGADGACVDEFCAPGG